MMETLQDIEKTKLNGQNIQNCKPGNLKKFKQCSSYFHAQRIQLCSKYTETNRAGSSKPTDLRIRKFQVPQLFYNHHETRLNCSKPTPPNQQKTAVQIKK